MNDLDPAGRVVQIEGLGERIQQFSLRCRFSQTPRKRLARIGQRMLDEFPFLAAQGHRDGDLARRPGAERLGQQFSPSDIMGQQDQFRDRLVVVCSRW